MNENILHITGEVEQPLHLTFADLAAIDAQHQIADVSQIVPGRQGTAVTLDGLLQQVQPWPSARYLGLHAAKDNFHASVPLAPIRERAILIYAHDGKPLAAEAGGPVRFFIPDHAACRAEEIDECANVKFVNHLELTENKGFDNRPQDEAEHEALHREAGTGGRGQGTGGKG